MVRQMILEAIRRFLASERIDPRRLIVAVSGGSDSIALLIALAELRRELEIELVAAHINHHLRDSESDGDEDFVRSLAERLEVRLHVADGTLDPESVRQHGIEAAARDRRFELLQEIRRECAADFIATAHQKNDQAETIVMRMMTGGGIAALRGIHPVREDGVIRPLLEVFRSDIVAFLGERGITARIDRSNDDPRFLRNRVRAMLASFDPTVIEHIASIASQAREQWRLLERLIDAAEDVEISESATIFRSMPDDSFLRQGLLLRHIRRLERATREVSRRDLERLASSNVRRQNVTKCVELLRRDGLVILRRIPEQPLAFEVPVTLGEPVLLSELGITLSIDRNGDGQHITLPASTTPHFTVRNRRPGDRFQPLGMRETVKLKDFLIGRKVPREERDRLPLLVWNGEIVWIAGVEVSECFKTGLPDRDEYAVTIQPTSRAKNEDSQNRRGL